MILNKKLKLQIKKLNNHATFPTKAAPADTAINLFSSKKVVIPGGSVRYIETGLSLGIPEGYFAKVYDKDSFGAEYTLSFKTGIIDRSAKGELKILVANTGDYPVRVDCGTNIAQLVLLPCPSIELEDVTEIKNIERGSKAVSSKT